MVRLMLSAMVVLAIGILPRRCLQLLLELFRPFRPCGRDSIHSFSTAPATNETTVTAGRNGHPAVVAEKAVGLSPRPSCVYTWPGPWPRARLPRRKRRTRDAALLCWQTSNSTAPETALNVSEPASSEITKAREGRARQVPPGSE